MATSIIIAISRVRIIFYASFSPFSCMTLIMATSFRSIFIRGPLTMPITTKPARLTRKRVPLFHKFWRAIISLTTFSALASRTCRRQVPPPLVPIKGTVPPTFCPIRLRPQMKQRLKIRIKPARTRPPSFTVTFYTALLGRTSFKCLSRAKFTATSCLCP